MAITVHRLRLLIALLLLCLYSLAGAQDNAATIHLHSGNIQPQANAAQWLDSISKTGSTQAMQVLIQFNNVPSAQERVSLQMGGITLEDYVPDNAYVALLRLPLNTALINTANLHSIVQVKPEWKADGYLWKRIGELKDSRTEVLIAFYEGVSKDEISKLIATYGGTMIQDKMADYGLYKVVVNADKVKMIGGWYGVKYINIVSQDVMLDYRSKGMEHVNVLNLPAAVGGYGLQGDSVTIGVGDNVSGVYHADLVDRIINYNPAPDTHHGVHVNGIVAGAGNIDPAAEGIAPHARLVDHFFENVWLQTGAMLKAHNMTSTNNSYSIIEGSCEYSGVYDAYSQLLDKVTQQYGAVTQVFAAGNDGGLNCTPYPAGFATIPGGYQSTKNPIIVTSTDKFYNNAWDGSRGPVRDGRLKPDVAANGYDVYSTIGPDIYEVAGGTSMASPQVAGCAGLLTQRYKQLNGNVNPSNDLVKALILNGATDIGNPGPDYRFGFGFLNLYHSLLMLNNHAYASNVISSGTQTINIRVPANTAVLKVMLYWNDTAGSPLASNQLVNDLDITVNDPSAMVHKPLVLDTTLANILNNATENEDHVNNCEQVTINNPAIGTYTVNVKAFSVPSLKQNYVVTYDIIPKGIQLMYPHEGDVIAANDSFQVYWDASPDSHSYTLEYSTDNGASWKTINNNIPANQFYCTWYPPNVGADKCKLRLTRNTTGEQSVSGPFVINPQPVVTLDSVQCPGSISMSWNAVPNATTYEVLRKIGPYMQAVATTGATSYVMSGLAPNSMYYIAVRPLINGAQGYRSISVKRQPNSGTCSGAAFAKGDLMLERIIAPVSGRQFTSTQLGVNENLTVQIHDLYNSASNAYRVSYSVNGGAWQTQLFSTPIIPSGGTATVTIPGLNLSATGLYQIKVAVTNLALSDAIHTNDTAIKYVLNLHNTPVSLSSTFLDDFETMPAMSAIGDTIGISPNEHWDFFGADSGRIRSYVNDSILISGNRSMSIDDYEAVDSNQNYLQGTFNLNSYNAATDEVRIEFDYLLHGVPKYIEGNGVWVRGTDVNTWEPLYNYHTNVIGRTLNSGTLSVTDALFNNGQSFSPSFQVRFGQNDTSLIAGRDFGNGITIDNFKIYTVHNDVGIARIISPIGVECGLGSNVPLTIQLYNGVHQTQTNVQLYYQLDGGTIINDTLDNIAGKDTVLFTFTRTMNLAGTGVHTVNVWLVNTGDTYKNNDSLLNYSFHNQPLITSFPYLENFEASNGSWYSDGVNNSWQYGIPASKKIHKAASGNNAWKTNLTGNYNNLETSYLYSPCFDVSGLSKPMLSFSMAMEIENCGNTLCDEAYIEYSNDGVNWNKLGNAGMGTNWYDTGFNIWHTQNDAHWHVASIPLPSSMQPIRLRFVFKSDPGATFEGLAVDDIHIFDLKYPIYNGADDDVTQHVSGSQLIPFAKLNLVMAEINPQGQDLGSTNVSYYRHDNIVNLGKTQYLFPASFTIKTSSTATDSSTVRLYILDKDVSALLKDTSCPSCTKAEDAYSMGITKYDDLNKDIENGTLNDNMNGQYSFYPNTTITWVPYDAGYYAMLKLSSFSELWLNDGGPTNSFPVGKDYLVFNARRINYTDVKVDWTSYIDTSVKTYEIERSMDGINYSNINTVNATHINVGNYIYTDKPNATANSSIYYRLKWTMLNNKVYYSPIRRIDWTDVNLLESVYPNPNHDGRINIIWTANNGTEMKLELTDIAGRVVYKNTFIAAEWNNVTTLTGKYHSGIYLLRAEIGGKIYTQKLVYR
ncbi:MAG: S8 family serine peptidase [Flavipsychrobacter sp.]